MYGSVKFYISEDPANYPVCTSARLFGWVTFFSKTEKKGFIKIKKKNFEPVCNLFFK